MKDFIDDATIERNREFMKNIQTYGIQNMTAFNWSESFVLEWADPAAMSMYTDVLFDFASPNVTEAMTIIDGMLRMFMKNANKKVFDLRSRKFEDVVLSCTFNRADDCRDRKRFVDNQNLLSCFTFNSLGNENWTSPGSGLQLTLFKNNSDGGASYKGTDSFKVIIHEPKTVPAILKDGVSFSAGKATTIKVERSVMWRENNAVSRCNESHAYSKEICDRNCLNQKCLLKQKTCEMFLKTFPNDTDVSYVNLTGFEIDYCYMALLYTNGVKPKNIQLFKVRRVFQDGILQKSMRIFSF